MVFCVFLVLFGVVYLAVQVLQVLRRLGGRGEENLDLEQELEHGS